MVPTLQAPLRVLMVASNHRIRDVRIYEREGRSLAGNGIDVTILTPDSGDAEWTENGVHLCTVRGSTQLSEYPATLWRLYKRAMSQPCDVVHCHEPESLLIGCALKVRKGVKLIYDAHEHYPSLYYAKGKTVKGRVFSAISEIAERVGVWFADRVITVNETLRVRFADRKPVTVIQNVPPRNLFSRDRVNPELEARFTGKSVVLHLGGMSETRGLRVLLEAFHHVAEVVPNAYLVILGRVDSSVPPGLETFGEIIPWVPFEEVAGYINVAKVGLVLFQPTHYNNTIGLPNKLFEYMACGKPVVASDFVEIRRVLEDTRSGILVNPEKADEVAEALVRLLQDPRSAAAFGRKAQQAVDNRYCWEFMEPRLLSVYAEVVRS